MKTKFSSKILHFFSIFCVKTFENIIKKNSYRIKTHFMIIFLLLSNNALKYAFFIFILITSHFLAVNHRFSIILKIQIYTREEKEEEKKF